MTRKNLYQNLPKDFPLHEVSEDICPMCGKERLHNEGLPAINDTEISVPTRCGACKFFFYREYNYSFREIRFFNADIDKFEICEKGCGSKDRKIKSRFEILDL